MPSYDLFNDFETQAIGDVRTLSRQLEQFRVCDFDSAMAGEIGALFEDPGKLSDGLRYFAFVERICKDLAKRYVKRPTRRFSGNASQVARLEDVYRRSRIDRALLTADQQSIGQNSVMLAIDPAGPLRVKPTSFVVADVDVEQGGDHMLADIRDAKRVTLRVPVRVDHTGWSRQIVYGRRVYTQDEAWVEGPTGEKVGLFNEDGTNPFDGIPLVAVRLTEPTKGLFLPALPLDLSSVQIGIILGLSDVEHICRQRCAGREVLTGEGAKHAASNMTAGAEGVWTFQGDDLAFQQFMGSPPIEKYLTAIETTAKLAASYKYVNPEGLWTSSGITGDAKAVEREEMLEERHRAETVWQDFEQDLVEVVSMVAQGVVRGQAAPSVSVDYNYVQPQRNDLQIAQARMLSYAGGWGNVIRDVKVAEGLDSDAAAREWVEGNLELWRDTLLAAWRDSATGEVQTPPGLDSIGAQVVGGG